MMEINSQLSDFEIDNIEWSCNKCVLSKIADIFPFTNLSNHDFNNILNTDSLKALENLPSFEITSKAYDIDSLNQFDIDVNIIDEINSRYYSVLEFKEMQKQTSTIDNRLQIIAVSSPSRTAI